MENHDINYTYGVSVAPNSWNSSSTTCLGNCAYFTALADTNGLSKEYREDPAQIASASIGSYIAITSGYGNTDPACNSNPPGSSGCALLQIPNIVDRLESARLNWKAYMEGYPKASGCVNNDMADPYNYHFNHNPFIYYADIQTNTTRCSNIVNANNTPVSQTTCSQTAPLPTDDVLINDLNHPSTAANYSFLTPNTVDDAHDCNDVSIANAWLGKMIPQILGSAVFKTKRAALFITFDEPGCTNPGCPPSRPELYSVWSSNSTNPRHPTIVGFKSVKPYTHYSPLRTIEYNWNLPPLVPSTDGSAQIMSEFFL
jgi:hypothetical protein